MSTLKHLVAERRAVDLAPAPQSASVAAQSPSVLVFKWNNQSWVLPWSYFLGAYHETTTAGEQLVLSFSGREVVIQGCNLDQLLADIAAYRLESLRELPEKYRDSPAGDGTVIFSIMVRPS